MSIKQIVYEKIDRLPYEKQKEVLNFVEFLESRSSISSEQPEISCYTLAQQWAGCIEDGADDMSFNKKYLEEYGQ